MLKPLSVNALRFNQQALNRGKKSLKPRQENNYQRFNSPITIILTEQGFWEFFKL